MLATTRSIRLALVTLALPILPACADDGEVDGDVATGWRATNVAITQQQAGWATTVDGDGNLTVDVGCEEGGRVRVEGSYDSNESFEVAIVFDGCTAEGVAITGELAMRAEVERTETTTDVAVSYSGELQWSGAANGECSVDVSASVSTSITGTGDDAEVDVDFEFRGDVCGYDAAAVVSAGAE